MHVAVVVITMIISKNSHMKGSTITALAVQPNMCLPVIRASIDALCRDAAGQVSGERVQRGCLTRQGKIS